MVLVAQLPALPVSAGLPVPARSWTFSCVQASYVRLAVKSRDVLRLVVVWFRPPVAISQEEVQAEKDRLRAIDARPIKKVAEAKARKQKRMAVSIPNTPPLITAPPPCSPLSRQHTGHEPAFARYSGQQDVYLDIGCTCPPDTDVLWSLLGGQLFFDGSQCSKRFA